MTRQGAAATISGAIPTAVSQPQPSAIPEPKAASPATTRIRRSRIQDCTTFPGSVAVGQHDAVVGLGLPPGVGAEGAGAGFVISKLSMIFSSIWSPTGGLEPVFMRRKAPPAAP